MARLNHCKHHAKAATEKPAMAMTRRTGGLLHIQRLLDPMHMERRQGVLRREAFGLEPVRALDERFGRVERGDEAFHALASSRRNSCTSWMETVGRNLANSRNSRAKKP